MTDTVDDEPSDPYENHYDLIVNGTGLVEAIVATSAAKAGLKVLHLDRNDYYGQLSTSYPLDGFFQTFQSEASSSADGDAKSSSIMQHHIIDNFPKHTEIPTLVPRDYSRNRARQHYHPIITGYQTRKQSSDASPSPERSHPATWGYDYERLTPLHTALQQSRDFNIDITPKLVMATGLGVDCLIDSGVNRYLEFKSIEGIFYAPEKAKIFSVPCSKGDVFNSKLLGALEKRVLTKFLMFAADYGRIAKGMSVSEMNEYDIAMGMALYRPQNKDVKSSGYEVEGWEDRSFLDFMTHCKIPKRLQSIITHALCMYLRDPLKDDETIEEGSTSKVSLTTTRALTLLSQHMESLSRYGDTALLATMYGSAEIPQAFCRMCAVWGGTYMLRTIVTEDVYVPANYERVPCPQNVQLSGDADADADADADPDPDGNDSGDAAGDTMEGSAVSDANAQTPDDSNAGKPSKSDSTISPDFSRCMRVTVQMMDDPPQTMTTNTYVSHASLWPSIPKVACTLVTRVIVCDRSVLPAKGEGEVTRGVIMYPPNIPGVGNQHSVVTLQLDSGTMVCPDDYVVLQVMTQVDVPQGAPRDPSDVVGRSTADADADAHWNAFVQQATPGINSLMAAIEGELKAQVPYNTLCAQTIVRPLYNFESDKGTIRAKLSKNATENKSDPASASTDADTGGLPDGIALCGENAFDYRLSLDEAVMQARQVFRRLFPDKEFMKTLKGVVEYTNEERDEEMEFLSSALSNAEAVVHAASPNTDTNTDRADGEVMGEKGCNESGDMSNAGSHGKEGAVGGSGQGEEVPSAAS